MFNKTKKVLFSFAIALCLIATFFASTRPKPAVQMAEMNQLPQKASYTSVVINFKIGMSVSRPN